MTLRKLWLIILVFVSIIAIAVNTLIFAFLTDRYFSDYLNESYDLHVNQILEYTSKAMVNEDVSYNQMAIELESHLNDPIIAIKLYDTNGDRLIEVSSDYYLDPQMRNGMMGNRMMEQMWGASSEEVHQYNITANEKTIGVMNITSHSLAENSFVARRFKGALVSNSLVSVLITILIAIFVGIIISRMMSHSLKDTEKLASDIRLGQEIELKTSGIQEINSIRESLLELNARLKLKQKTRKKLIDQLVHQTRTPLTILQSHIEAIEDGVIEVDDKEIQTFKNQIFDITSIISNMSSLIGASKDTDELKIESFELGTMLKQMQQGLVAQFMKKNIEFVIDSHQSIKLKTDKYKLSQAIYNLLINAYKYTEEKGLVKVSYTQSGDRCLLKIEDSGIGIAEKDIDKIFSAYYRSSTVIGQKGDGIGLYIVRENIKRIGGNVTVESKVGAGSLFTIDIPIDPIFSS
jgi:signal transduction histidine kinase